MEFSFFDLFDLKFTSRFVCLLWAGLTNLLYIFNGILLVGLIVCSGFISAAEAAFFSLSDEQIAQCRDAKNIKEKRVAYLLKDPKRLLATILLLNNFINVAFVTFSTHLLWKIFGIGNVDGLIITIYTIASTAIIVVLGEVMPKMYGINNNLSFAKKMTGLLSFAVVTVKPFASLLMKMDFFLEKTFVRKGYSFSKDKLNRAVEITTEKGTGEKEREILKGIFNFSNLTCKQVMRPRIEVVAIDVGANFHELIRIINASTYSRLPVYSETIDKIVGILYIKDILPYLDETSDFEWKPLLKKCFFVPENKKIDSLLLEFQEKRVHMAIVVDEYGGTSGLITMEDIIEEIIGDVSDEFDQDEVFYRQIDKRTFVFKGKVSLNDFCKVMKEDISIFEGAKGESESLGGLLLEIYGGLPQVGKKIVYRHFTFTTVEVDSRRIKRIHVQVHIEQEDNVERQESPR